MSSTTALVMDVWITLAKACHDEKVRGKYDVPKVHSMYILLRRAGDGRRFTEI